MRIAGIEITCAWDVRLVARLFYPNSISMQRKWVAAWRWAPGPRVPIGQRVTDESVAPAVTSGVVGAMTYLRARNMRA